jgi:hypothetical protein
VLEISLPRADPIQNMEHAAQRSRIKAIKKWNNT